MTPTGQATQNMKVSSDNAIRKQSKGTSLEDSLGGMGFEALFANAMVAGQSDRNSQGLQQALQSVSNKARPTAEPPSSLVAMNGVAGAVQAAVANRNETGNSISQAAQAAQAPKAPDAQAAKPVTPEQEVAKPATASSQNTQQADAEQQSKPTENTQAQTAEKKPETAKTDKSIVAEAKTSQTDNPNTLKASEGEQKLDPKVAETLKQSVKVESPEAQAKPNIVASAATDKAVRPEGVSAKQDNIQVDAEVEVTPKAEVSAKQNQSERSVRAEAHELAASKGAEKADFKTQLNQRAETVAQTNGKQDINPQAVAAQAMQNQGRQIQSGDNKLVTAGVDTKGSINGQGIPSLSAQPSLRTGSAAQAEIKTPVNQPGFAKELGQKITWALGKNLSTVDIRVNPEQMGTLNMRILQKGQNIQLVIRTSDETSGAMLQQAISGLRESMSQNGLQLGQVQIHSGNNPNSNQPQFGQNLQGQQQGGSGQSGNQNGQNGQQASQGDAETSLAGTRTQGRSDGNLDLFA